MPVREPHVTDPLVSDLVALYANASARLELIVSDALRRGLDPERHGQPNAVRGDATAAYRARALAQARAVLAELDGAAGQAGPVIVRKAYRGGLVAVDRTVGDGLELRGRFGGGHQRAAAVIASNMTDSLAAAATRIGTNIEDVFARANALDRGENLTDVSFVGRRVDDPWRKAALRTVGEGVIAGDTRAQVSAQLARRLVTEGTTDALTGFIDKAGRRWPLHTYTAMVARTTTREAMTTGTGSRLREGGLDLVTISSHPHAADDCTPYDGRTFSLDGKADGYDVLDEEPPFHPNCVHVMTPAGVNLDEFERELGDAMLDPDAQVVDDLAAADRGEVIGQPKPAKTPEGKIGKLIDDERAAAHGAAYADALENDVMRIAGTYQQGARIMRAYRGRGDLTLADLTVEQRGILEAAKVGPRVQMAEGAIAAGDVPLPEDAVSRIGEQVRRLVDRRLKAADARLANKVGPLVEEKNKILEEQWARLRQLADENPGKRAGEIMLDDPQIRAMQAKARKLDEKIDAHHVENRAKRDDALLGTLRRIRPGYGEGTIENIAGAKVHVEGVKNAAAYLPREWVERSNTGQITVKGGVKRAYAQTDGLGDGIGSVLAFSANTSPSVYLHELGHRLQRMVSGIEPVELEWYLRRVRTADGGIEPLRKLRDITGNTGYRADEVAREDQFLEAYIGKDYATRGRPQPREVLTVLLEGIFYGKHRIPEDPDARRLILGLLAAV